MQLLQHNTHYVHTHPILPPMKFMIVAPYVHAWARRRRTDRLSWLAETLADREPCRDARADVDRLREAAGHAEQRATVAEGTAARLGRS
jgi:hypothetical protein